MAADYSKKLGFSFKEHCAYAQLVKIAGMYMPTFSCDAGDLQFELEKFLKADCPDVNYRKSREHEDRSGEKEHNGKYTPYLGGPDPTLQYYTLEKCCEELEDLILHLQNCDAPEATIKAQKHARKTISQLQKFKSSKYYPHLKKYVDEAREKALQQKNGKQFLS